jgi:hypothetical protein
VRNGTNWSQQGYLKASNTGPDDNFGWSVTVSSDMVVVGAWMESSNATGVNGNQSNNNALEAGAAYVFVRTGTTWRQQAYLKASNTAMNNHFGFSVATAGDTVVVGAADESSTAGSAGAIYVFTRNGTNWSQQSYLNASNPGVGDRFGWSVAVSGNTAVVGALGESSNATGVNGNQSDNSADTSGAAYVFVRDGTNWTQQAYVKASNTDVHDWFGWSVGVSGDTILIGAYLEDSNATGVNGNHNDNSALQSGAAYVFVFLSRVIILTDGSGGYYIDIEGRPNNTYRLQRAGSVTGPWSDLATNTAPASGLIEYHETSPPPGQAFYRAAQP